MQINDERYWRPIEKQLRELFYQWYYAPILDILEEPVRLANANSAVIAAIRSGKIAYNNGEFTGSFNARISRELSKYAEFDRRSKTWKGRPPADVLGAAIVANDKAAELNRRIQNLIPQMEAKVQSTVDQLKFNVEPAISGIDKQLATDLSSMAVPLEMTEGVREKIIETYTNNMRLNIVNENGPGNWNAEQVTRLREMVEKNIEKGLNRRNLIDAIQAEWDTTKKKAVFLARQETSLFLSEYSNARYEKAGVRFYKWMTSNDARVVGNPGGLYPEPSKGHSNHFNLAGKVCRFDDPSLYADTVEDALSGKWKSKAEIGGNNSHPGEDYLCRCSKRPVIT